MGVLRDRQTVREQHGENKQDSGMVGTFLGKTGLYRAVEKNCIFTRK